MSKKYIIITICLLAVSLSGCKSADKYHLEIDQTANEIIDQKQHEALGETYPFSIERPSDILRRRLLEEQKLIVSSEASLGADRLKPVEYWPEEGYSVVLSGDDPNAFGDPNRVIVLNLVQALEVGAKNSFTYQERKETVFRSALALELEREVFRRFFTGSTNAGIETDSRSRLSTSGRSSSSDASFRRLLTNGAQIASAIGLDLVNLLTGNRTSALGLAGDASITMPLLRGSGEHIVTEPLTQAERDVIYAMWEFERFRKEFAVTIASEYLSVLRRLDAVKINEEDYRSRITSVRRSLRLAEAGRVEQIEVDQAIQQELSSRQRWIASMESYKLAMDSFKRTLGLPPDAAVELDPNVLQDTVGPLVEQAWQSVAEVGVVDETTADPNAPIVLEGPDLENAGPMELDEGEAIRLALSNRLDLFVVEGRVYDAQRAVVVAADQLGADLTLLGTGSSGSRRAVSADDVRDGYIRLDRAAYSGLLTLDMAIERTQEAVAYRNSFIGLEEACRNVQLLEDQIKLDIRTLLRNLLQAREDLYIQANAVQVAQKRVRSTTLFLEAGRAQMRDLLEAQDALLSARIDLTAAAVDYRVAEWEMQRDLGLLKVDEKGLWKEYAGSEASNG